MTLLSLKNMPRVWGYAKRKIKRCIPKEGMPHAQACQKKRKEKKAPNPKRKKKREMVHTKEFIHHPSKISTHLHILIKVYDLFLLWIRSLTQQNMRSSYAFNPPYLQLHKNSHQRWVEEERHNKKALVKNYTH